MSSTIEAAESSPPENPLANYSPRPGVPGAPGSYDELLDGRGQIRESWRQFAAGLGTIGLQGLGQRYEQARRLLRENGIMQGVSGFPHATIDRHWELDPLPLLLAKSEWDSLASAVAQRAALAEPDSERSVRAADSGRRGLDPAGAGLRTAGLPVALPRHRGAAEYLHASVRRASRARGGRRLERVRRLLALPRGAGLALENRIVTSRILPTDFYALHVERLAGFFITLRDTLQSLSLKRSDNPRVVLLSHGPRSPSYFEDAYLARYLGYTLVEGGDLTVRGTNVYLKTLGGLLPVDVIIRRMHGEEADPLELRYDSTYGVAGLVQAVRNGQVVVANALGSGLVESPALMAFLPAICRSRLGEELKLPCVPTWWCGRDEDWAYVEAHFDELVIRPAVPSRTQGPVDTALLDRPQREHFLETIRRHRMSFAAQARVNRSTAPVFVNGGIEAWPIGLRVFSAAGRDGAYRVMPGGLARAMPPGHPVPPGHGTTSISRPDGAASARRPQRRVPRQGRVGPFRPAGGNGYAVASAGRGRGTAPQQQRFAEPRGRQPVLAWPAHRAGRRPRPASAERRPADDERTRAFEPAGDENPRADAGGRRPAGSEIAQQSRRVRCCVGKGDPGGIRA